MKRLELEKHGRHAAVVAAIAFVLLGSAIRPGLAATPPQQWVHIRYDAGQIKDEWDNLDTGETYFTRYDGNIVYINEQTNTRLWYSKDSGVIDQDAPTIYAPGETPRPWTPQSPWGEFVASYEHAAAATRPAGSPAPSVISAADVLNGVSVIRFDSYTTDIAGNRFLYTQLWADPRTRLPVRIKTRLQTGERTASGKEWSTGDYDFPIAGPADLFALGVPRGTPIHKEVTQAPDAVQPVLDAINQNHDHFLKNYRAVVLTVMQDNPMQIDALDIIWRDGEKVREDHHFPDVELQTHPTPPLPRQLTPESLVAWSAQHEPVAKQLIDGQREYVWFAPNAKSPRPRVQMTLFRNFPHLVNDNSWPEAIQWPTRNYVPDFQLMGANAETVAGCAGLRTGGDGNDRIDYYVDPSHDYVCIKKIEWNKRGGKWTKSRVLTLSNLRRIEGHIVAGTRRVRSYSYDNSAPSSSPVILNEVTTIDLVPLAATGYPPGIFDSASLAIGADMMGY